MKHEREVTVRLTSSSGEESSATATLRHFTPAQRLLRAAGIMVVTLIAAAAIIPIPIIHLVGIPLMLLIGTGIAIRTWRASARLSQVKIPCPRCGAANSIGGGLGYRSVTEPISRACESCRRALELRIG